jgi:hypothetical protein
MILSTILNLVLVPVIYVLMSRFDRIRTASPDDLPPDDRTAPGESAGLTTANI